MAEVFPPLERPVGVRSPGTELFFTFRPYEVYRLVSRAGAEPQSLGSDQATSNDLDTTSILTMTWFCRLEGPVSFGLGLRASQDYGELEQSRYMFRVFQPEFGQLGPQPLLTQCADMFWEEGWLDMDEPIFVDGPSAKLMLMREPPDTTFSYGLLSIIGALVSQ